MKLRTGFVSNSSSSSFVIFGTNDSDITCLIEEKIKIPGESDWDALYKFIENNAGSYYGSVCFDDVEIFLLDDSVWCAGIPFNNEVKDETTIGELKQQAADMIGKLVGEEVSVDKIELICDTSSDG